MECRENKLVELQSLDAQHFPCTLSTAVVSISKQEWLFFLPPSAMTVVSDGPSDQKQMLSRGEKTTEAWKMELYWPCFFHILLLHCSMEMCDERNNITMCPLCDRTCSYWKMSSACATARASHLFDNPATVFFSVFMALWGKKMYASMLSF